MKWEDFSRGMTRREREAFLGLSIETKKLIRKFVEQSKDKAMNFPKAVEILADATAKAKGDKDGLQQDTLLK